MRPARGTASVPVPATAGVVRAGPGRRQGAVARTDLVRPVAAPPPGAPARSAAPGRSRAAGPGPSTSPPPRTTPATTRPRATHGGSPQPRPRSPAGRVPPASCGAPSAAPGRQRTGGPPPEGSAPTYGDGCVRLPRGRRAARNPGALRQGHRGGKAVARPRRSSLSSFLPYNLSGSAGGSRGAGEGPPGRPENRPASGSKGDPARPSAQRPAHAGDGAKAPRAPSRPPDPAGRRHHVTGTRPAEG